MPHLKGFNSMALVRAIAGLNASVADIPGKGWASLVCGMPQHYDCVLRRSTKIRLHARAEQLPWFAIGVTMPRRKLVVVLVLLLISSSSFGQHAEFTKWPDGRSPQVIGKRVAERFVDTINLTEDLYPAMCTWYGALKFADATHDPALTKRLVERFNAQFTPELMQMALNKKHVDFSMAGSVPFQIYLDTRDPKFLAMGRQLADHQWEEPAADGLTRETRFWIDDMYMITILQVQAYRATGNKKYLDRAALEMSAYLEKLQQPNGLFYHAPDVPFFWGRGNGWVAAGLTELLQSLPKSHPQRKKIFAGYQRMMATLLKYQGQDGVWRQLIDRGELWPETSSTAMFAYAMTKGVKNGWLKDKAYGQAVRKAWLGLTEYLEPNGDLRNICEGTGKYNDYDYYVKRKRNTGDLHGQAPLLWTAAALIER
jgi:rhamnogalacturonyl hydrolase YesR